MARVSNSNGVRRHNERLVLSTIRRMDGASKAQLAKSTGLSPRAAERIVESLEADGPLVRAALTAKLAGYDLSVLALDMTDYGAPATAGASAGLTGALAIAYRTTVRQWPMHWAIGAQHADSSSIESQTHG